MGQNMKVILCTAQDAERENGFHQSRNLSLMNMKVNMKEIKKMVLEYTDGRMVQNMKVFSRMI